jgi:GNAT superfamily N-acetyltransferase
MSSGPALLVRRATPADAAALASLRFAFRSSLTAAVEDELVFLDRCVAWMRPRLTDDSRWRAWLVEADGVAAGNVWLQLIEKIPNPGTERELHAYLTNFFIRPEYRGQGAGSRMLSALVGECDALAVDTIFLWPTARSRSLYERHGFTEANSLLVRALRDVS